MHAHCTHIPDSSVKTVGTKTVTTLSLEWSPQNVMTAVAKVFLLQLICQDLLGEAWFVALH